MPNPALNQKNITRYDRSEMLRLLESFPEQCRFAASIGDKIRIPSAYDKFYGKIICAGMGGSAIGADIAKSYLAGESRSVITVNRNYRLPAYAGKDCLVVAMSYSGNTEETLSAYKDARSKKTSIIAVTSGGRLKEMAQKDGNLCVTIPGGMPPRCALGYSFFPLLSLLSKVGAAADKPVCISETLKLLAGSKDEIKKRAGDIALKLRGKYPVIYSSQDHMDCVATRWRGQFAENAKTLSSCHVIPEANHNEIMGWQEPIGVIKKCAAIFLRDKDDNPRIAKRMDITAQIISKEGSKVIQVESMGKGLLGRIFSLIYTGDFASFYLAILNKVDPTSIDRINYLKERLAGS